MNQFIPALCLLAVMIPAGVVLVVVCIWAERKNGREADAAAESWQRWDEWNRAAPDPENPKYLRCWNNGGGERFVADRERYYREHPRPETKDWKPTIRR